MSVSRSFSVAKTLPTNVSNLSTLSYYDDELGEDIPIPFIVKDGVLDINIQDNVNADLLSPGTSISISSGSGFQVSVMGGLKPVSSLSTNMITFLKNFIAQDETNASNYNLVTNIEIYNAPTMTKVRFNYIYDDRAYQFHNEPPVKTTPDPVSGKSSNNYRVIYIFKSPLVVSYKYNGGATKYLTLTSLLDIAD